MVEPELVVLHYVGAARCTVRSPLHCVDRYGAALALNGCKVVAPLLVLSTDTQGMSLQRPAQLFRKDSEFFIHVVMQGPLQVALANCTEKHKRGFAKSKESVASNLAIGETLLQILHF